MIMASQIVERYEKVVGYGKSTNKYHVFFAGAQLQSLPTSKRPQSHVYGGSWG